MSKQGLIGQQMYTRGREGVFRINEGFDTVAKSPSLDNSFIKKTLHPFCVYQAPQELRQRSEQELTQYPEAFTVFHADTGELVMGRSLFAGVDFTGQRDSIFVHNLVVPQGRKEELIREPQLLFRINGFVDRYDSQENGKILPDLEQLPIDRERNPTDSYALLSQLGMTEQHFKLFLWAVMMAIPSNKKVYVILDVPISESSRYAKQLMEIIYRCLPIAPRRKLGFTTYHHQPKGKKFIDVMFVDKGTLRSGDRSTDKDYLFDFPGNRFAKADLQNAESYLDFIWSNLEQEDRLAAFYAFAEEALLDAQPVAGLALATYDQLCTLFMVDQGRLELYEQDKEGIVAGILAHLSQQNLEQKPRLDTLFWRLVDKELALLSADYVPSLAYVEAVIGYYPIGGHKRSLTETILRFLFNAWNHSDDQARIYRIFQSMLKLPQLFRDACRIMLENAPLFRVLEAYIIHRFSRIANITAFQDEISFWLKQLPEVWSSDFFRELLLQLTSQLLEQSREPIADGRSLHQFVDRLGSGSDKSKWQLQIANSVVTSIQLDKLNAQQFENLDYIITDECNDLSYVLQEKSLETLSILRLVWQLIHYPANGGMTIYDSLDQLHQQGLNQVQSLMRRFLVLNSSEDYERVVWAFYNNSHEGGRLSFAYREMLEYVDQTSADPEGIYQFLNWSASYRPFIGSRLQINPAYAKAIKEHFHRHKQGALKNRKRWKRLKHSTDESIIPLYWQIRLEQSPVLIRFLVKNMAAILKILMAAFLVLVVGSGGVWAYQRWIQEPDPAPQPLPTPAVSPSPRPDLNENPDIAVPMEI